MRKTNRGALKPPSLGVFKLLLNLASCIFLAFERVANVSHNDAAVSGANGREEKVSFFAILCSAQGRSCGVRTTTAAY